MRWTLRLLAALGYAGLVAALPAMGQAQTCPRPASDQIPETMIPGERQWHARKYAWRRDEIARQLATTKFGAIALGDSIVQRWPDDLLASITGLPTLNAGVNGDLTQTVAWELEAPAWSGQRPRDVFLLIGTNDGGIASPCDIYWGIRNDVRMIHQALPAARIFVISILPRGRDMSQRDASISMTNRALAEGTAAGGYHYVDAHDAFLCNHRTPCALMTPRAWVHPSPAGYEILSRIMRQAVASSPSH